jgi:hypothetical protein
MNIQIDVTPADFEGLWINSMKWRDNSWRDQTDRFDPKPTYNWKYSYWFDSTINLVMAKAFLVASNADFAEHIDNWDDGSWVILTNYASPCHLRKELVSA